MTDDVDTLTLTISTEDASDEVELPAGLVDLLAEGDQNAAETVGDITLLSFASRAHHFVHHAEGTNEDLEAQEERIMDLFEERFGQTYGEMTGHQH
jgi:hypothetical protein